MALFKKGKPQIKFLQPRPRVTKFAAPTGETMSVLITLPKDARVLLEQIIPVFDQAREQPPTADRWLWMLRCLPTEVLETLPQLRQTKSRQAGHVTVMLAVFARCLLHPIDETGLRCEMSDDEVHLGSNRLILFYFPAEALQRRGYLEAEMPADPFSAWTTTRIRYTADGLAHNDDLDPLLPHPPVIPTDSVAAGKWVELDFNALELASGPQEPTGAA